MVRVECKNIKRRCAVHSSQKTYSIASSEEVAVALTIGFMDALSGRHIAENPYDIRGQFPCFDAWRNGWRAYKQQVIPQEVRALLPSMTDEAFNALEADFRRFGNLYLDIELYLHKRVVRP